MAFIVKGKLGKRSVAVEWNDGNIITDEVTKQFVEVRNNSSIPTPGPHPMSFYGDRLKDDLSAYWFINDTLNEVTSVEGDIPYPEEPPEGAIN